MTVLDRMGEWISSASPSTPQTRQRLAIHLLDTVGAWIAGRATGEGALLIRASADTAAARVVQAPGMVKMTEVDDFHRASCTAPGSIVIPAALTTAARIHATRDAWPDAAALTAALHAGYEAVTRFGIAVAGPSILSRGLWPTYLVAPLGAAAVAARLLGLNAEQTAHALGIALAQVSGAPGGHAKIPARWILLGFAVQAGCAAAFAAAEGLESDRTLLDQDWLARTHGITCDPGALLAGRLNDPADVSAASAGAIDEVSLKIYCAARQCAAAIDGFRALLADAAVPASQVASVRIAVPPAYATMIGHRQTSGVRAGRITSAAYHLALAAHRPDALLDIARPDLSGEPAIAAFIDLVEVAPDDNLASYYPRQWPARVDVVLADGRILSQLVLAAAGDPESAATVEVNEKFHRLVDPLIGAPAAAGIERACLGGLLHDAGTPDLYRCLRQIDLI